MKLTKYALMAAGCAMFAACSSDEPVQDEAVNPNAPAVAAAGEGYVAVNINLPTAPAFGGRANETAETYDDGLESEYAVKNAYIIVFEDPNENHTDYQVVCTAQIFSPEWNNMVPGNTAITTKATATGKIEGIDVNSSQTYSAAIVLNTDGTILPKPGVSYTQWLNTPYENYMRFNDGGTEYLTMTSAPIMKGAAPVVLTPIDKTKVKETAAAAENEGSAGVFYVQRAVAKVAVKLNAGYTLQGQEYADKNIAVDVVAWNLDITNKTSFPVQNTEGLTDAYADIWKSGGRFLGSGDPTRVYWGKDYNYSSVNFNDADQYFNRLSLGQLTTKPTHLYTVENTFDIENQRQYETTRVVLKAQIVPNSTFNKGDNYYRIKGASDCYTLAALQNVVVGKTVAITNVDASKINVNWNGNDIKGGSFAVKDITVTANGTALTDGQALELANALGFDNVTTLGFTTYVEGYNYYVVRIKHFGDFYCKWQLGNPTYGGNNAQWLGRYGVVRNNSYEININKFNGFGDGTIPAPKDEPDDENEFYISVTVNVLSWAKRVQNVDL